MIKRRMCSHRFCCTLILALAICGRPCVAPAQNSTLPDALFTFTLDFPGSQPEHYSIEVPSPGVAHYTSTGRLSADSDVIDGFNLDFSLTPATRQKIFDLVARAGYLQKDVASHRKGMAFTGNKTLIYQDAQRHGQATFNYTANTSVEELTSLMQNLSATLEFGHRLDYYHHYQKLALDEELKRMEEMSRDHELSEVPAIQPILEQIISDSSVINVTRARAQRLLDASTR
jgi:hypothetical protein